jgi:hypothetical protein
MQLKVHRQVVQGMLRTTRRLSALPGGCGCDPLHPCIDRLIHLLEQIREGCRQARGEPNERSQIGEHIQNLLGASQQYRNIPAVADVSWPEHHFG